MGYAQANIRGYTLVELLISTTLSLIILSSIAVVFLPGHTGITKRNMELMLSQDVNDALQLIKMDILRAGYSFNLQSSFIIEGAEKSVHVMPSKQCIGYGYKRNSSDESFRSFYLKDEKLNAFLTSNSKMSVTDMCSRGSSLLDDKIFKVKKFEVIDKPVFSSSAVSQLITINFEASTFDGAVTVSKSLTFLVRNWS
ncbi:hypothetical protein A1OS_10715 [Enterovibrio norvegicus]|uniref:PilW family protein n=1 Tax=Enterovibrio norvegicus TaxID=188144 RepID=UPI00036E341A|nr:prepilin-type N-terminal cleavage/methylation domain-containing protein [Enterovibrio norvegicus]OEE43570.1 hypothetical protein A1OS_10715 [Enterovibrio norvegicus]